METRSGDGGSLHVKASIVGLDSPRPPDALVRIQTRGLHAALLERVLEVPMDIYEGRVDGELRIHHKGNGFPDLSGTVKCRDTGFHFWDAPDDLRGVNMDLIFQGQRLYLHNAQGWYGAVPLHISGDMDVNPDDGEYRLSAQVGANLGLLRVGLRLGYG